MHPKIGKLHMRVAEDLEIREECLIEFARIAK